MDISLRRGRTPGPDDGAGARSSPRSTRRSCARSCRAAIRSASGSRSAARPTSPNGGRSSAWWPTCTITVSPSRPCPRSTCPRDRSTTTCGRSSPPSPISFVVRTSLPVGDAITAAIKAAVHDVDPGAAGHAAPPGRRADDRLDGALPVQHAAAHGLRRPGALPRGRWASTASWPTASASGPASSASGSRSARVPPSSAAWCSARDWSWRPPASCSGLAGALALTRLLTAQLFGVSPTDPGVIIAMARDARGRVARRLPDSRCPRHARRPHVALTERMMHCLAAGPALCRSRPPPRARVHRRRGPHPRARHRRHDHHLHGGERRAAPARCRTPHADRIANIWNDFGEDAQSLPAVSPLDFRDYQRRSRTFETLRRGVGGQRRGAARQPDRRGRARAGRARHRHGQLLSALRRARRSTAGTSSPRRRRRTGRTS